MAQTIKLKRSASPNTPPSTSQLELGEVAINTYDGKMYIKKDVGGTESIVEIGGSGADLVSYLEAGMIEYEYTATSNQTTFSGSDNNSATLSYTANSIMVFLNGVLQDDGVDYTATNGTSVVFTSALAANDEVRIVAFTNVTTTSSLQDPTKLDAITTVNAQAAYSLTLNSSAYTPSSQNALIVSLNGITQEPGDSFTISGSTITFSPALVTGDVVDYIVDMGRAVTIGEYSGDLAVGGELEVTGEIIGDLRGAILFKAQAGETLAKGDVVYISGISGNTTVVSKADADDSAKMPAFGLVAAAASSGNPVDVYTFGTLSGLDTSSFSEGDELFVSTTAGTLTNSAPTGESAQLQKIAKVTRSHNSSGSIKIMGAGRSNAVPNLDDGNVFIGNSSNQAEARALTGDDISGGTITSFASTGIDDNATSTAITIDASQDVTFTSDAKFPDNGKAIFGAGPDLQIYHNGSNSFVDASGVGHLYLQAQGDDRDVKILSDDGVGGLTEYFRADGSIGEAQLFHFGSKKLNTTSTGIDVTGDVNSDSVTTGTFTSTGIDDNATSTAITIDSSGEVLSSASGSWRLRPDANSALAPAYAFNGDGNTGMYSPTSDTLGFSTQGTEKVRITSSGNVGIGTDSPVTAFEVEGSATELIRVSSTSGNSGSVVGTGSLGLDFFSGSTHPAVLLSAHEDSVATYLSEFSISLRASNADTTPTERMRIDSRGNVGIGETSPDTRLHVTGTTSDYAILAEQPSGYAGLALKSTTVNQTWSFIAQDNGSNSDLLLYGGSSAGTKMTVDHNGNVGIGNNSPVELLHVYDGDILIEESDASTGSGLKIKNDSATQLIIRGAGSTRTNPGAATGMPQIVSLTGYDLYIAADGPDDVIFTTNRTEAMRISSNGQLKIGGTTNSPANVPAVLFGTGNASLIYNTGHTGLHINNEEATAGIDNYGAGISFGRFASNSDDQSAAIVPVQTTSDQDHMGIAFLTHDTNTRANPLKEKMRLDADGNLLVGTTTYNSANEGILLGAGGIIYATNDGGISASFGRNTTDGSVVNIRKDNTTVGSIGTTSGVVSHIILDPRTGVKGAGLLGSSADANTGILQPVNHSGALADGAIQLGTSSNRFKDLYLSGGAYLGGTGSANYLDDYEEGTWEPTLTAQTSNPSVTYHTDTGGYYIKTGRMVFVTGTVRNTAYSGGSGYIQISNLPFGISSRSNGDNSDGVGVAQTNIWNGSSTEIPTFIKTQHNTSRLFIGRSRDSSVSTFLDAGDWGSTCMMSFTIVYYTN